MYARSLELTSFPPASAAQLQQAIQQRLDPQHYQDLKTSGLSDEQILVAGHFSIRSAKEGKQVVGVKHKGLAFRYLDPWGKVYTRSDDKPFYRIKPSDWNEHQPLEAEDSDSPPRYLTPAGAGNKPYFSPLYRYWQRDIKRSKYDLDITEGEKKADCACAHGIAMLGLAGVYGWLDKTPRAGELPFQPAQLIEDPYNAIAAHQDLQLHDSRPLPEFSVVALEYRRCNLAFDSDIVHKLSVKQAQLGLALWLEAQKARPYIVLLPNELDGSKNGVDDFIVRHGIEAYQKLREIAQPALVTTKKGIVLNLSRDPKPRNKAVMSWSVLKEHWTYRPGVGWYHWEQRHWKLRTVEEFETDLSRFMDAQGWEDRNMGVMNAVVRQLRSLLLVPDEHWNLETKLGFRNGTLDLETEQFCNHHQQSDYLTSVLPYDYNPLALCPTWSQFLQEALGGDQQAIELLQAFIKYILLPKPRDRKAEIEKSLDLVGPPGTGKGTVLDIIEALVGSENCGAAGKETFKNPAALANLLDTKVAIDRDASGFLGDVGLFNKIVSNEPVPLKRLYRDVISARLCTVPVRAYNKFLDVPDGSEGLNRRIIALEFNHIPQAIDTELRTKLQAELPGIFAWAWSVSKLEMKRRILWAGAVPTVAEASIKRFEANNPEYCFLADIFANGQYTVKAGELYQTYTQWCSDNGHRPKSLRKFGPTIQAFGCKRSDKIGGNFYYDIPAMSQFDVIAHLGIARPAAGQLGTIGDNHQRQSNPLPERLGDDWGQSDSLTKLQKTKSDLDVVNPDQKRVKAQSSPIIPNPEPELVSLSSPSSSIVPEPAQLSLSELKAKLLACTTVVELQTLKCQQPELAIKQAYAQLTPEQKAQIKALTQLQIASEQKKNMQIQPLQVGDHCIYVGSKEAYYREYSKQLLTIDKIDSAWGTASCKRSDGSFTTWLPLQDLKQTTS